MTNTETTIRTFDFAGLELRVIMHMAEPWFVATDVCKALGIQVGASGTPNATAATRHLGTAETTLLLMQGRDKRGRKCERTARIVSESGLYKLIMRSDKPEARKFQDWVTREVLPSIRKTGGYLLNEEARETAKADDRQAMPLPEAFANARRLPLTLDLSQTVLWLVVTTHSGLPSGGPLHF